MLFDKYVEMLCYFRELFQRFGSIRELFGAFLTEIREPATPLAKTISDRRNAVQCGKVHPSMVKFINTR